MIIGSGPAGWTAAIYAARANLSPMVITGSQPGGQLTVTTGVENYPGFIEEIQGPWLMEQMRAQAERFNTIVHEDEITAVDFSGKKFIAKSAYNSYEADAVIIATGAQAKWLGIESETEFRGYGVSGCATCDGFFFKKKIVAVVGGGNSAVEEAIYLTNHADKVYLIHRKDSLKAEKIMQDRLFNNPKIEVLWNKEVQEIIGEKDPLKFVTGVNLRDTTNGSVLQVVLNGIFIAIGHKPNTGLFKGVLDLDDEGYILTTSGTTKTSMAGVFAAGDVQDKIYRQAVTAAGTGCMAALDVQRYLEGN